MPWCRVIHFIEMGERMAKSKMDAPTIFGRLRDILSKHAGSLSVKSDTPAYFCLEGTTGPSTVRVWKGKLRSPKIPVAWVKVGKSYVSYHLMGLYGNPALSKAISKGLKTRMQGKTCFNFSTTDDALFAELDKLTGQSIEAFKKEGYIAD